MNGTLLSDVWFDSCPFCGNDDLELPSEERFTEMARQFKHVALGLRCEHCNLDMFDHNHDKDYGERVQLLADMWNRRM